MDAEAFSSLRYRTVAESLRDNAWRHVHRAIKHTNEGRFDWAEGSKLKALRNFQRASKLDGLHPDIIMRALQPRLPQVRGVFNVSMGRVP